MKHEKIERKAGLFDSEHDIESLRFIQDAKNIKVLKGTHVTIDDIEHDEIVLREIIEELEKKGLYNFDERFKEDKTRTSDEFDIQSAKLRTVSILVDGNNPKIVAIQAKKYMELEGTPQH